MAEFMRGMRELMSVVCPVLGWGTCRGLSREEGVCAGDAEVA